MMISLQALSIEENKLKKVESSSLCSTFRGAGSKAAVLHHEVVKAVWK